MWARAGHLVPYDTHYHVKAGLRPHPATALGHRAFRVDRCNRTPVLSRMSAFPASAFVVFGPGPAVGGRRHHVPTTCVREDLRT